MSAIAVNRAGWPATALLGTRVSDVQAMSLAVPELIGWFDDDPAGNTAWAHLRKRMAIWPTTLRRVITSKDPKHIHRAEIVARLEGTYD
jgi:DNA primase